MKIVNYNKKKTDDFKELETAKNIIKQIYDTKLGALNNAETVFQNVRSSIPELADVPFEVQFPLDIYDSILNKLQENFTVYFLGSSKDAQYLIGIQSIIDVEEENIFLDDSQSYVNIEKIENDKKYQLNFDEGTWEPTIELTPEMLSDTGLDAEITSEIFTEFPEVLDNIDQLDDIYEYNKEIISLYNEVKDFTTVIAFQRNAMSPIQLAIIPDQDNICGLEIIYNGKKFELRQYLCFDNDETMEAQTVFNHFVDSLTRKEAKNIIEILFQKYSKTIMIIEGFDKSFYCLYALNDSSIDLSDADKTFLKIKNGQPEILDDKTPLSDKNKEKMKKFLNRVKKFTKNYSEDVLSTNPNHVVQ